jgi:hypothetical protein
VIYRQLEMAIEMRHLSEKSLFVHVPTSGWPTVGSVLIPNTRLFRGVPRTTWPHRTRSNQQDSPTRSRRPSCMD